jgi:hypothetical protein
MHTLTEVLHALKETVEQASIRLQRCCMRLKRQLRRHAYATGAYEYRCIRLQRQAELKRAFASAGTLLFFFGSSNACVLENPPDYISVYIFISISVCLSVCLSTCVMYVFIWRRRLDDDAGVLWA